MKITLEQLPQQLQKELAAIYLISGDEILLSQEAAQSIYKAAQQQGFVERKVFHLDTGFVWDDFLLEANNLSLFSEKLFLELHLTEGKLTEAGKTALEIYAEKTPQDKILLLVTAKLDTKITNTSWFKKVEKKAVTIAVWPIDANRLPAWIKQRLQRAGLTTDNAGLQLLADLTEGNLLATQQAIEKLCLYYNTKNISADEIAAVITDNARFDIFSLVDQTLAGNAKKVIATLKGLQAEGTEANIILWALTRELRNLINMANALLAGNSMEQVLLQFHVWEKRKSLIQNTLRRHSIKKFHILLQQAAHIDEIIKGANTGNYWQGLLDLTLALAKSDKIKL